MKVTYQPDISTWSTNCECSRCYSKMEISGDDLCHQVKKKWYSDAYGDGGDYSNADVYYVICPICSNQIDINQTSTKMPFLLTKQVKAKHKGKNENS